MTDSTLPSVPLLSRLGSDTSLFVRGEKALRAFDSLISTHLDTCMKKAGVNVVSDATPAAITKETDGTLTLHLKNGKTHGGFNALLTATGRRPLPLTAGLGLEAAGVKTAARGEGYIEVDEYQNTSAPNVYALGDVCGQIELTPMAIAAGRRLADRLFGNMPHAKADYTNVPTVVFSHPPIGTVGLTEAAARAQYGDDKIKVYTSTFVNLWYGTYKLQPDEKPKTAMKLVCLLPDEKVVGLHSIGASATDTPPASNPLLYSLLPLPARTPACHFRPHQGWGRTSCCKASVSR